MKEVETQNRKQKPESGLGVKKHVASLLDRGVKHLCGTNLGWERGDVLVSQASTDQLGSYVKVSRGMSGSYPLATVLSRIVIRASWLNGFRKQCFQAVVLG